MYTYSCGCACACEQPVLPIPWPRKMGTGTVVQLWVRVCLCTACPTYPVAQKDGDCCTAVGAGVLVYSLSDAPEQLVGTAAADSNI